MQNKKLLIIGGVLLVIVIAFVSLFLFSNKEKIQNRAMQQTQKGADQNQQATARDKKVVSVISQPTISFGNWVGFTPPTAQSTPLGTYTLKQSFSQPEVTLLAQKLQTADSVKNDKNTLTAYSITTDKTSFMVFNMRSGEFVYNSTKGIPLASTGTVEEKSTAFLQSIGWYDPSLKVSATYKDRKKSGVTYVEIHRNWNVVGGPILNSIGLLNIPLEHPLASLTMNQTLLSTPKDSDIYGTTDNKDGLARSTDFNTMTLAIDDATQSLKTIKSNIRPITSGPLATNLISYQQAVDNLISKKYSFIFTTPSGGGSAIDWQSVYPGNIASAKEAHVTENILAYLEETPMSTQTELKPYYIFRGYSQLDSGYRVTFTAAVPATPSNVQSSTSTFSFIHDAYASQDATQKQGTFDSSVDPTPLPTVADQLALPDFSCKPSSSELTPVYENSGVKFGWAPYTYWKGEYRSDHSGYWYYIPEAGTTASVVNSNLDSIIAALEQTTNAKVREERSKIQYDISKNLPAGQKLEANGVDTNTGSDLENTQKQGTFYTQKNVDPVVLSNVFQTINDSFGVCPIRLTGSSPTVFVYGPQGKHITISPTHTFTYTDPYLNTDNDWHVTVNGLNGLNSLMVNGGDRPYLYYEYDKVSFNRPTTGWNVRKDALKKWVAGELAEKLQLTSAETDRAYFEIEHASRKITSNTIFVSILPENEVNAKVPLFSSEGTVTRVHFYVGTAHKNVVTPVVDPITRPDILILELGSHAE